jgi:hypothetical protein
VCSAILADQPSWSGLSSCKTQQNSVTPGPRRRVSASQSNGSSGTLSVPDFLEGSAFSAPVSGQCEHSLEPHPSLPSA